jgi:hypothetical protein
MKPRHLLLGAGLAIAAALAAFGDKSAQTEVAEAVERPQAARPAAASAAPAAAAVVEPAAGKGGQAEILRLVPREVLIGDSADQFGASDNDVFGHQDWTAATGGAAAAVHLHRQVGRRRQVRGVPGARRPHLARARERRDRRDLPGRRDCATDPDPDLPAAEPGSAA